MSGGSVRIDPAVLLAPVPVAMVSCKGSGSGDKPNIITLAWIGVACSDPPVLSAAISPKRFSYDLILSTGEYVVNLVDRNLAEACDYCGIRSGRDVDKFEVCGLDAIPAEGMIHAPAIAQSPLSLSCRVMKILPIGSHDLFLGEVVGIRAAETLVDKTGKLDLGGAGLIAFNHGEYFETGRRIGFFGYSVARPKVLARRLPGHRKNPRFE
ncbi:MAG: flavin reductase family protein [Clostridia bacterium]|nr:flavin reductase family protein [Clostridia bacterium]